MRTPLPSFACPEPMPGSMSSVSVKTERAVTGAARNRSPVIVNEVVAFSVSIIGDSAVTVIVSATVASLMSMSTANVLPARNTIPSCRDVANPWISAVSTTVPGGKFTIR